MYKILLFSFQPLDDRRQSGSGNAKTHVHPSRFADHRRTVDAEGRLISQIKIDQQY